MTDRMEQENATTNPMDKIMQHVRELAQIQARETESLIARFVLANPDVPIDEIVLIKQEDGLITRFWVERQRKA